MLRFNAHREMTAKYDGKATCGNGEHAVKAGDTIGYANNRREKSVICAACWRKWSAENAEAAMWE